MTALIRVSAEPLVAVCALSPVLVVPVVELLAEFPPPIEVASDAWSVPSVTRFKASELFLRPLTSCEVVDVDSSSEDESSESDPSLPVPLLLDPVLPDEVELPLWSLFVLSNPVELEPEAVDPLLSLPVPLPVVPVAVDADPEPVLALPVLLVLPLLSD